MYWRQYFRVTWLQDRDSTNFFYTQPSQRMSDYSPYEQRFTHTIQNR